MTPVHSFKKGDVYKINPLEILVTCNKCNYKFLHHYKIEYEIICKSCKESINGYNHVQQGYRPVIIVQDPSYISISRTVTIVPLTTSSKRINHPGIVIVNHHLGLKLDDTRLFSFALIYQITTVNQACFLKENYCGSISDSNLNEIDKKLKMFLAL